MNETHMRELMELEQRKVEIERQKLAIQFAAIEVAMDDKIQRHSKKVIDAVSRAISGAVVQLKEDIERTRYELSTHIEGVRTELKADIRDVRTELKADIADVRTELKADIHRLEEKIDCHAH